MIENNTKEEPEEDNGSEEVHDHVDHASRDLSPRAKQAQNVAKYETIWKVMRERPGAFTEAELCRKHSVPYGNYQSWKRIRQAKELKAKPAKFIATSGPAFLGQSVVVTTVEDLTNMVTNMVKDAVKSALHEGIKSGKVKIVR